MAEHARRPSESDPTHYPVSEEMPEPTLQRLVMEELRPLVQRWLDERGEVAFVGADQFIYWVQHEPTTRVAPDVYVLPGVPRDADFGAWKVWETGICPSLAIEIVGHDVEKDYAIAPARYDAMGVDEVVIFDPGHREHDDRCQWQVFRRQGRRLVRTRTTDDDRIYSRVLGCWLRVVGEGSGRRVRIGTGRNGDELFASRAEAAEQRADAAEQRAVAAEAELARLREDLAKRTK